MPELRIANQVQCKSGAIVTELFANNETSSVDMGIADSEFIFDILTDISKNKYQYVVRETFSNAYDATLKANTDKPIKITLASITDTEQSMAAKICQTNNCLDNEAIYSITDHGIGMSPDDVKKYFLQYGGSKKNVQQETLTPLAQRVLAQRRLLPSQTSSLSKRQKTPSRQMQQSTRLAKASTQQMLLL